MEKFLRSQEGLNWNMGINWSTNESTVIDVGDTDRVVFAGFTNSVGNAATPGGVSWSYLRIKYCT